MGSPDRRTALRISIAALGGASVSAGLSGCSDGGRSQNVSTGVPVDSAGPARSAAAGSSSSNTALPNPAPPNATPADMPPNAVPSNPVPSNAAPSASAAAELNHASSGRRQVALTFHGDGDPKLARELLAEAESAGAKLTVLAVGRWLGEHPEMARRILDGGHELGNHTESHADISRMAPAAAYAEIEACAARLRRLTGSPGRWFRPSQTRHADTMLVEQARRVGYQTVLSYDVDSLDYQDPPASSTVARFLRTVQPGAVVSLHLGHAGTVAALPAMLDGLKNLGLTAVTASELFA